MKKILTAVLPIWLDQLNLIDNRKKFNSDFAMEMLPFNFNEKQREGKDPLSIDIYQMEPGDDGTFAGTYNLIDSSSFKHPLCIMQNRICQILFSDEDVCLDLRKRLFQNVDGEAWVQFLIRRLGDDSVFRFYIHRDNEGKYDVDVHATDDPRGAHRYKNDTPRLDFVVVATIES